MDAILQLCIKYPSKYRKDLSLLIFSLSPSSGKDLNSPHNVIGVASRENILFFGRDDKTVPKFRHETLLNFLSSVLREEGGFEYKKKIVDSMLTPTALLAF